MSSPPPAQPHLVSLVLQSKKALQYGEQLCTRAHSISDASARISVDVLALDAKVRWMKDAISQQLELVAVVAKCIEESRESLRGQARAWDALRVKHTDALENILESLGSQHVPPDFHQHTSEDVALFGSQCSDDDDPKQAKGQRSDSLASHSPSSTLRQGLKKPNLPEIKETGPKSRVLWKTLRDFVDDQAIEDVLETIENDRLALDDIMQKTDEYPETLTDAIGSILDSLPELLQHPREAIRSVLAAQDTISTSMAQHLESLTSHYGQMANALQDSEAGEEFSHEDIYDMNRDTQELPSIMAELEESANVIKTQHSKLEAAQAASKSHLSVLGKLIDDLDELGNIMDEMLCFQNELQAKCEEELDGLHDQLPTLDHLRSRYVSYQFAFNKLILELARRRNYREAAANIVRNMAVQLDAMSEEEDQVRKYFNTEFGANLPQDLCLCIENSPTRWEVLPRTGDAWEFLPSIGADIIAEAKDRTNVVSDQEGNYSPLSPGSPSNLN